MARVTRDKLEDDHLISQFRAFFDEVSKAQARAMEMRESDPQTLAALVSKSLVQLIELQSLESRREGNRFELQSIADYTRIPASAPVFQITKLSDGEYPFFWSSTTHLDGPPDRAGGDLVV